jgi:ApeA N-terminal domain 1
LGISTTGKEITLRNCLQKGARQSILGEIHETTFHVTMMFVGCHFLTAELVRFRGFSVQVAHERI